MAAALEISAVRRLAAILAADVAGYSRLMGRNEEGTLERLMAHRRALVDPKIAEHHGRIVKTTGDGLLVEFPSVVDGVRCAVEMQRGMAERNSGIPIGERLEFRVGINLSDVIVEGDDIYGDGVNIAARGSGGAAAAGSSGTARKVRPDLKFAGSLIVCGRGCPTAVWLVFASAYDSAADDCATFGPPWPDLFRPPTSSGCHRTILQQP